MNLKQLQLITISIFLLLFVGCESDYEKGYSKGESHGYSQGRKSGYKSGYSSGKQDGYFEGKQDGVSEGKKIGYEVGYTKGKQDGKKEKFNEAYYKGYIDKTQGLTPKKNLEVTTVFAPYMINIATYIFVILGILFSLLAISILLKRNLNFENKISEISFIMITIFMYYKFIESRFIDYVSLFLNQLSNTDILILSLITIVISYAIISIYTSIVFFTPISHIVIEIVGLVISVFIFLGNITFLMNWQMIASSIGNLTSYIYVLISFSLGILLFLGLNYKKIFRLH